MYATLVHTVMLPKKPTVVSQFVVTSKVTMAKFDEMKNTLFSTGFWIWEDDMSLPENIVISEGTVKDNTRSQCQLRLHYGGFYPPSVQDGRA